MSFTKRFKKYFFSVVSFLDGKKLSFIISTTEDRSDRKSRTKHEFYVLHMLKSDKPQHAKNCKPIRFDPSHFLHS